MSYTPTTWATGDVITAEKLNNMESGIENAPGVTVFEFEVISDNDNQVVTEATVAEVAESFNAGKLCIARICKHATSQPTKYSAKEDCVFSCFGEGTRMYCDQYFMLPSGTTVNITHNSLSGNQGGWTYSVETLRVQAVTE